MAEVWFYHLEQSRADDELPGLLQRGLERGYRMSVHLASTERLKSFSSTLWGYEETAFIPHGCDGEPYPERQPIYLTATDDIPNAATYRFFIEGTSPPSLEGIERATIMFDGNDEGSAAQARDAWRRFKGQGATIRYWKKQDEGRWVDQAAGA